MQPVVEMRSDDIIKIIAMLANVHPADKASKEAYDKVMALLVEKLG